MPSLRPVIVLAFLLATSSVCNPQGEIVRNGYWWGGMSPQFKLGFVSGYVMTIGGAHDLTALKCLAERSRLKSEKGISDETIKECEADPTVNLFVDYSNLRFGQLLEGTDEFYKDFRNKNIQIGAALHYVRDQLKGVSAKDLEEELTSFRKQAAK